MNNLPKQRRSWHVPRRQNWRDPRRGLRTIERYVHDVVTMHPTPPRTFDGWLVVRQQVYTRTILAVLSILIFIGIDAYLFATRSTTAPIDSRYVINALLLSIGLIGVLWTQLIEPAYRWWFAVRHGYVTIASVTTVTRQTLHYGEVADGRWSVVVDGSVYETTFRLDNDESGYWIWRMAVGSQVHVLVHPTKRKVLIALGLVETDSSV
jgi:hypothetical protein